MRQVNARCLFVDSKHDMVVACLSYFLAEHPVVTVFLHGVVTDLANARGRQNIGHAPRVGVASCRSSLAANNKTIDQYLGNKDELLWCVVTQAVASLV